MAGEGVPNKTTLLYKISLTRLYCSLILHNDFAVICPTYLRTALSVQCVRFVILIFYLYFVVYCIIIIRRKLHN